MRKRKLRAAVALGLAIMAVGGALYATNMAFKFNYVLLGPTPGISASGTSTLSLPYIPQSDLTNASALRDKINAAAGASVVISISRLVESSDTLLTYAGTNPANNFPLDPCDGYLVQVSQDVEFVITGAHDPFKVAQLNKVGTSNSFSGTSLFSFPYHGTPNVAEELYADIGPAAVVSVSRLVKSSDTLQTYAGTNPANNFPLRIGEAYYVQVAADVPYIPSTF